MHILFNLLSKYFYFSLWKIEDFPYNLHAALKMQAVPFDLYIYVYIYIYI